MLGLIVGAFLSLSSAHGQDLDAENDPAVFRHQVEQLNERYEDFFSHEQRLKLYEDNLKRSIPELKQQRQTYQREALEAMRLHRQQRRDRPDDTMMEQEDERNKKAEQAVQERHRREYISRRDQLSRISESARKIPANRDAGLE